MDHSTSLFHLVQKSLWETCQAEAVPYYPPTYAQDGFIHLTKDPAFLLTIGNHFYKTVKDDFLLLCIKPDLLTAKVVFEPAASVGATDAGTLGTESEPPLFPHLYGTIDYPAVLEALAVTRGADGTFLGIPGLGLALPTPGNAP